MSESVAERLAIKVRQVRPGTAQAIAVSAGQVVQIVDMKGQQVARMVAFVAGQPGEVLSVAASRVANNSLMIQQGQQLVSNLGTALLEVTGDSVGRHDTLVIADPRQAVAVDPAALDESLPTVLAAAGIAAVTLPDPVSWFQNVSIQQRGELAVRQPLSEAGDDVLLTALVDLVIAIEVPSGDGGDILVRLYREVADVEADKAAEVAAAAIAAAAAEAEAATDASADAAEAPASEAAVEGEATETAAVLDEIVAGVAADGSEVIAEETDTVVEVAEDLPVEAASAIAPATYAEASDPVPAEADADDGPDAPKPAAG